MNKLINIFLFVIVTITHAQSSDILFDDNSDLVSVDSIHIIGNDITEEFVILEELTFDIGDLVNEKILEFNKERLYSLRIFSFVDLQMSVLENRTIINIIIKEAWYIYPWPFLHLHHSSFKYASYGFYLRWKNFRGRNESIRATVSLGYDPYYKIDYVNPYLLKNENVFFSFHSAYQKFQNKSSVLEKTYGYDINYKVIANYITLGKRINKYNYLSSSIGFNYLEINDPPLAGALASDDKIDKYPFLQLAYTYDTRDLKQYPQNGFFGQIALNHKGFGFDNINYNILSVDIRNYWNIFDDFVARSRLAYRKAFGPTIPFYDYSYLGYNELVRGHSRDVREGHSYILGTVELSYPLIKEWAFSLDLPLIPERITSTRIGLNVYLFADTGKTFMNYEKINSNLLDSGWGIGINILFLPYSGMRIEYAINEYKNGEILIGTDYSF